RGGEVVNRSFSRLTFVISCCLTMLGPSVVQAEPRPPWERAPLAAPASEVLAAAAAARKAPSDAGVVVLLQEIQIAFDKEGKSVATYRRVRRVLSSTGASSNGALSTDWSPWYEERPQIRARVITADGRVHWLESKSIVERTAGTREPDVYSDHK